MSVYEQRGNDGGARLSRRAFASGAGALSLAALMSACGLGQSQTGGATPGGTHGSGVAGEGAPSSLSPRPTPTLTQLSWGPTSEDQAAAAAVVEKMSVEQRAGQVLLPFYQGVDAGAQLALVTQLGLAGTIIMGDNVPRDANGLVDVAAMRSINQQFQQAASTGKSWPAIISVDQEGGIVQRLKAPLTVWPTPASYGAVDDLKLTERAYHGIGAELRALGFTMDNAPSIDVTIGPGDPVIGSRSFGMDAQLVARNGVAACRGLMDSGVLPTAKHFPGHGSVSTDSHVGLPVQQTPIRDLRARDWVPFVAAIKAGVPVMMMGHIALPELEAGVPSSLSAPSYQALRGLGFEGVIVTDALNMGAVTNAYPAGEAAVKALAAGADLLLMPADARQAHAAVVDAVQRNQVPPERLADAATKVATLMTWWGREHPAQQDPDLSVIGSPDSAAIVQEVQNRAG